MNRVAMLRWAKARFVAGLVAQLWGQEQLDSSWRQAANGLWPWLEGKVCL